MSCYSILSCIYSLFYKKKDSPVIIIEDILDSNLLSETETDDETNIQFEHSILYPNRYNDISVNVPIKPQ